MSFNKSILLGSALVMALCGVAPATVIYYDDFSGNSASNLNGTAPDIRPGDETWIAQTNSASWTFTYHADGTVDDDSGGSKSAWLPVTIDQGNVYVLSSTFAVNTDASDASWVALSYAAQSSTYGYWYGNGGYGAYLNRRNGQASTYAGENLQGSTAYAGPIHDNGVVTVTITLDASDADPANWTMQWGASGNQGSINQPATTASAGSYSNIHYIGFSNTTPGMLSNVTFQVIPEPVSLVLPGLGGLVIAAWCRRCVA
jgi:hypothetical protein